MKCSCGAVLPSDAAFCGACGQPRRVRRRSLVGAVLDARYRVEAKLAAGGFATIYRATHLETGAEVALKVLHADHAGHANAAARFRREGAVLAGLRDPHTVATYEIGQATDGTLYIAMELLKGQSLLEQFDAAGPIGWRKVLAIARAVCSSLAEAHALGLVHRDLKPANIHLEPSAGDPDFVKVLDFGVAKVEAGSGLDDGSGDLTRAGVAVGTVEYMAPEQLMGSPCDARTDLFSLGVVMYEMVTGQRPWTETGPTGLMTALLTRWPAPPSTLSTGSIRIPAVIDRLIMRCLDRDPAARFQSAGELIAAIDQVVARAEPAAPSPTRRLFADGTPAPETATAAFAAAELRKDMVTTWIDGAPPMMLAPDTQPLAAAPPTDGYVLQETVGAVTLSESPRLEAAARVTAVAPPATPEAEPPYHGRVGADSGPRRPEVDVEPTVQARPPSKPPSKPPAARPTTPAPALLGEPFPPMPMPMPAPLPPPPAPPHDPRYDARALHVGGVFPASYPVYGSAHAAPSALPLPPGRPPLPPLPRFDVGVAGTEVRPRYATAPGAPRTIGAMSIAIWAVVLLSLGLLVGALIAVLSA
jgi:hypothetical protein